MTEKIENQSTAEPIVGKDAARQPSKKKKVGFSAVDVAFTALMSALICVCSWISIPAGDVPFTLQTFAVFLAAGLLGRKKSVLSVLVYILLGAAGVPVFAGFKGGIGSLVGPTGGYIIGFIFSAYIAGLFVDKLGKKLYFIIIGMVLGLAVCYAFGTVWFMAVYTKTSGAVTAAFVLGKCVVPYIIPDLAKIALAIAVTKAVSSRVAYFKR